MRPCAPCRRLPAPCRPVTWVLFRVWNPRCVFLVRLVAQHPAGETAPPAIKRRSPSLRIYAVADPHTNPHHTHHVKTGGRAYARLRASLLRLGTPHACGGATDGGGADAVRPLRRFVGAALTLTLLQHDALCRAAEGAHGRGGRRRQRRRRPCRGRIRAGRTLGPCGGEGAALAGVRRVVVVSGPCIFATD